MSTKPNPQVDVALAASSPTCHLSGSPPFTLSITITSRASEPFTFQKPDTIFDFPSGLDREHMDIIQASTGRNVNTRHVDAVRLPVPLVPANEDKFITLHPNVPYVASHTFRMRDHFRDIPESIRESLSDGYPLREGGDYTIRVAWNTTINRWWWGTKEEVLDEDYLDEWKALSNGPILLQRPGEPRAEVNIHVVE